MKAEPIIADVAARIRQARIAAGLTQAEVAQRAGVDLRTITRVEGVNREPSISTVVKLARGIGVTVSDLLHGIE